MSPFDNLESYDSRLLCGHPTIAPRMADVPVRLPLPGPEKEGSIYENQKGSAARSFGVLEEA